MNVFKIDKALQIIKRREQKSNEGNADMHYSEYMEIKELLESFLKEQKKVR